MSLAEHSVAQVTTENGTEYALITTPVALAGEDGQIVQHAIVHHVAPSEQENIDPQTQTQVLMLPITLAPDQQGEGQVIQHAQFQILQEHTLEQLQAQVLQEPQLVQLQSDAAQVDAGQQDQQPLTEHQINRLGDVGPVHEIHVQIQTPAAAPALPVSTPEKTVIRVGQRGRPPANRKQEVKPPVGKGPFKCDKCDKVFPKWTQHQRHVRGHENDKPHQCHECGESFNVEDNLRLHVAIHQTENPVCPECGKRFSRMASLKAHLILHEKEENLICPECGDEYGTQGQLDRHLREHREEDHVMKIYPCKHCNQEFTKLSLLREHVKQHVKIKHSLARKSYKRNVDRTSFQHKCTHCSKSFQKPSQLKRHVRIHTGERPYKCTTCDRAFNQKGALSIHMMKHTKERPHPCQFCPQSFSQRGNLRAHIERVHNHREVDGKPMFSCEECDCSFRKLGSLHSHMSRVHSESWDGVTNNRGEGEGGEAQTTENSGTATIQPKVEAIQLSSGDVNDAINQQAVIQQLLQLSEQVTSDMDAGAAAKAAGAQATNATDNSDILQQALENSGLPIESGEGPTAQNSQSAPADKQGDADGTAKASSAGAVRIILPKPTGEGGSGDSTTAEITVVNQQQQQHQQLQQQPGIRGMVSTMSIHDSATGTIKKHTIRRINGVRWHQCMYCSKEFKKPSDLIRHIRIHTHEKPYKCTQCFRAFAVKSTLTAHLKTHSGIKEFKCHVCQKLFSTQGSLKVHLRLHTGAKPFDCPHCEKKFRTSGHCKSHIQSHFRGAGSGASPKKARRMIRKSSKQDVDLPDIPLQEPILITDTGYIQQPPRSGGVFQYLGETSSVDRPYKCPYCSRGFKKSSHLKQHIRSHTGEKPYKCVQCLKSFVSSGVLKSHIRTHTGVKAYKCRICSTPFTTNGSLKRHMSTHSEVRPFMCPYCQKRFKTSVNCKKHMKTHKHELAVQALHQQQDIGPVDQNTMLATEVTVGPDIPDVNDDDDSDAGVVETNEEQIEVSQTDLAETLIVQNQVQQHLVTEQQTAAAALGLSQVQVSDGSTVTVGPPLTADAGVGGQATDLVAQQAVIQDALVSDVQLQSTLNQQVLGQQTLEQGQQGLAQSLLNPGTATPTPGFGQLNLNQLMPIGQQGSTVDPQLDITTLTQPGGLTSTNMQNILQTKEPELVTEPQRQWRVTMNEEVAEGKRSHRCPVCNKAFKKSSHLKQHMRSHTGEKPFQCGQCQKHFVSAGVLRAHLKTHQGSKEYRCNACAATFTTNGSLTRHMLIHNSQRPFKCPLCSENFRTSILCKRHLKTHRQPELANTDIEEDDVDRRGSGRHTRPIITITDEQAEQLSQTAPTETMSLSEKILIESAAEKERISEMRGIVSRDVVDSTPTEPVVENNTVAGRERTGLHYCQHCLKAFKKPSDLVRHVRIHTGEKPFECEVCQRTFTVKSTLDSHMKTHQQTEKRFTCHVCTSAFSTKGSLKVHMRLHTGAKPFKCPHCSQRFRTSGHRKSHIAQHFKPALPRKPRRMSLKPPQAEVPFNVLDLENATVTEVQPHHVPEIINAIQPAIGADQMVTNQVINIDQSMLQGQGVLPVSLSFADAFGNFQSTDGSNLALQGLDGVQLQLTGNMAQGIQITGLDSSLLNQTVQIDASLLQQLQQQGNINLSINPNVLNQATAAGTSGANVQAAVDPNQIQNIAATQQQQQPEEQTQQQDQQQQQHQQQQIASVNDIVNPNAVIQSLAPTSLASATIFQGGQVISTDEAATQPAHIVTAVSGIDESQLIQAQESGAIIATADTIQAIEDASATVSNLSNAVGEQSQQGTMNISILHSASDNDTNDNDNDTVATTQGGDEDIAIEGVGEEGYVEVRHQGELGVRQVVEEDSEEAQRALRILEEEHSAGRRMNQADPDRIHFCELCQKGFKRRSHLKEHMLTHMPRPLQQAGMSRALPHSCTECDKSFSKPSLLERHLRIHTGERPYVCDICQKAFNQKNTLQIHLRKHSGARPHLCPYCDQGYAQKGNLKTHIKRAHHLEMVNSMNLPEGTAKSVTVTATIRETAEGSSEVNKAAEALKSAEGAALAATGTTLDLSDMYPITDPSIVP